MRPPRISFAGGLYHVNTRCNNREFYFRDEEDFRLFLKILLKAKKIYKVRIYAYCVTNNHFHLLVETPGEANLSKFMQYVNGNFARAYNKRHGRSGRFWGERFRSTVIEGEPQFFNTLIYIELNMLRCGAVNDPADWRWSSYRAHALGTDDPILDLHELYLALGDTARQRQENYQAMVAARIEEKGLRREPVFTSGVILGSKSFVESLLEEYGKIVNYYKNRQAREFAPEAFSLRTFVPVPDG